MLITKGCEPNAQGKYCPLSGTCPGGCAQEGTQNLEISQAVVLTPAVEVGTVTTSCLGTPAVCCKQDAGGTSCTVTLTQQVSVTIPVEYGVSMSQGQPSIACGGPSCGC